MTITERHRIAQELHDGIAQDLVGIGYSLDLLLAQEESSDEARLALRTLRFTVTELVEKVRQEIYQLRQQNELELPTRIQKAVKETITKQSVHISLDSFPTSANFELAYQIERIATEVLRNIAAHSGATTVWISLICGDGMADLVISDDGGGGLAMQKNHYGFAGIQERAAGIGALLEFESSSDGTRVQLRVPFL